LAVSYSTCAVEIVMPRALFRRLVDLVVRRERRAARLGQNLRDRCRQRRLAMVDVTNRADVAVRLGPLKFALAISYLLRPLFDLPGGASRTRQSL
jgi:hypothetical protein